MRRNEIYIGLNLQDPNCTMMSPWYRYPRDENGLTIRQKTEWDPDNLVKLNSIISKCMQDIAQKELLEALDKQGKILYVDCQKKWENDILFFIFTEYIKQSTAENKKDIVSKAIGSRTIVTEDEQERKQYVQENQPNIEEMITHYSQLLKSLLQANDDIEYKRKVLNFESDIAFEGLGRLMLDEKQSYMYVYLDQIQSLITEEQQRINMLLYTRWTIPHDKRIRLKINNWNWLWKTRTSMSWHRVQATHDYSETTIYEEDVQADIL